MRVRIIFLDESNVESKFLLRFSILPSTYIWMSTFDLPHGRHLRPVPQPRSQFERAHIRCRGTWVPCGQRELAGCRRRCRVWFPWWTPGERNLVGSSGYLKGPRVQELLLWGDGILVEAATGTAGSETSSSSSSDTVVVASDSRLPELWPRQSSFWRSPGRLTRSWPVGSWGSLYLGNNFSTKTSHIHPL